MSLKAELETWCSALEAYDAGRYQEALDIFGTIAETSRIFMNMGLIHATVGDHDAAVRCFVEATRADKYLAIAYFQAGVSNFLLGQWEDAIKDFDESYLYLRGNNTIFYEQLGLNFKLYSAEVLFNRGLTMIYMGRVEEGMRDLEEAYRAKVTSEHDVINEAIRDRGSGYTVFSMPVGVLFRPPEKKVRNTAAKDYLGRAKLIASDDSLDTSVEFSGVSLLKKGISPSRVWIQQEVITDGAAGLGRSRSTGADQPKPRETTPISPLARSNTALGLGTQSNRPPLQPLRQGSLRRPYAAPSGDMPPIPVDDSTSPARASPNPIATERKSFSYYEDVVGAYEDKPAAPSPIKETPRSLIDSWRMDGPPRTRVARTGGPPPSSYYPPSIGGASLARKMSQRTALMPSAGSFRAGSDYGSDEGPFELVKIRVKMHYQDDLRGMTLTPETPYEEFVDRVAKKFDVSSLTLSLKFKDEDGSIVSLLDSSDYELAIETAREHANGRPEGKLEVWCD
ncbi:hypothetical protein PUNSTDRAFT_136506 [Punctularia strigosozonata HHB-11173 SS5]|uniref:uncharacterized protein n=1 Tax=Punctularia strigosozonata (strain HHB-11173) TaxID=741275 RepID=UPI000441655C|nr:uncharacterized protein PUNSTDRAFT_136506 [Punctularia strigosozonata HHB-11173 SS5]EIN06660.1 hypothetical protein PUNSTDRAFT_136506 [Punctularia strigosozonata HHB-11173 SS5]